MHTHEIFNSVLAEDIVLFHILCVVSMNGYKVHVKAPEKLFLCHVPLLVKWI